jgi:hypothetical protein
VPVTTAKSRAGSVVAVGAGSYLRSVTKSTQDLRGAEAMRQQQITRRITKSAPAPLDLRTPTGRPLPF